MKYLSLLFFVTLSLCGVAQITHTNKGNVDKNAEAILDKASKKINSGAVSFSVTMINKDEKKNETARMKADVLYHGGKYRVSFDGNIIYCDGKSTWHWNKDAGEVTVNPMSEAEDDLMNPASILSNYSKNFKAKYIRKEQNGNVVVDLTPRKPKSYYKIRLVINDKNGILQQMEMHNYDSTCGEYKVSNFKSGVKDSDSDYTFPKDKNPNVEVIDMR